MLPLLAYGARSLQGCSSGSPSPTRRRGGGGGALTTTPGPCCAPTGGRCGTPERWSEGAVRRRRRRWTRSCRAGVAARARLPTRRPRCLGAASDLGTTHRVWGVYGGTHTTVCSGAGGLSLTNNSMGTSFKPCSERLFQSGPVRHRHARRQDRDHGRGPVETIATVGSRIPPPLVVKQASEHTASPEGWHATGAACVFASRHV
jgi:hypothetical protein